MIRVASFLLWIISALVVLDVAPAQAQDFTQQPGCPAEGFTNRIVECIKTALIGDPANPGSNGVAGDLLDQMYTALQPAVAAFITLAVLLFGARLYLGMVRKPGPEIMMMGLKVVLVVYFIENFIDWFPPVMEAVQELMDIISDATVTTATLTCDPPAGVNVGNTYTNFWHRADCMAGAIFGFGGATTLITGIVGLVIGSATTDSGIGFTIFLGGLSVMLTLLLSLFRAVYVFIAAYIAVTFLLGLAPIFMPLILIPATAQYFTKWMNQILSYLVQPIFLIGYLALMMATFNVVVLTGENSMASALFGHPVSSYDEWASEMEIFNASHVTTCETEPFSLNIQPSELGQDTSFEWRAQGQGGNFALPETLSGIDYETAFGFAPDDIVGNIMHSVEGFMSFGTAMFCVEFPKKTELFYVLFALGALCYIFYTLLEYIPTLAAELTGSAFGNVVLGNLDMPGEGQLRGVVQGGAQAAQTPGSTEDKLQAFLNPSTISNIRNPRDF